MFRTLLFGLAIVFGFVSAPAWGQSPATEHAANSSAHQIAGDNGGEIIHYTDFNKPHNWISPGQQPGWMLTEITGGSKVFFSKSVLNGSEEDLKSYAFYKEGLHLEKGRSYTITVACSVAAPSKSFRGLKLGIDHLEEPSAEKAREKVVLNSGLLNQSGWRYFSATFVYGENLLCEKPTLVLWADYVKPNSGSEELIQESLQAATRIFVKFIRVNPAVKSALKITRPLMGAELPSCDIRAEALNLNPLMPFEKVDFFRNGEWIGTDSVVPYQLGSREWAAGPYWIRATGHYENGTSSSDSVKITVREEKPLNLNLREYNPDCENYFIGGKIGPEQVLVIHSIEKRMDENGSPWPAEMTEKFASEGDSLEWKLPVYFSEYGKPVKLYYSLMNRAGCMRTDSMVLYPQKGRPETGPLRVVSGFRFNEANQIYSLCDNAANGVLKGSGASFFEVLQEPGGPVLETTADTLIPIKPEWIAQGYLYVRAGSHTGCEAKDFARFKWLVNPAPTVWADTLISYGGQPAIGKAYASGGTEPYTFTWTGVDTCFTGNCDSARVNFATGEGQIFASDVNGCQQVFPYFVRNSFLLELDTNTNHSDTIRLELKKTNGYNLSEIVLYENNLPIDTIRNAPYSSLLLKKFGVHYYKMRIKLLGLEQKESNVVRYEMNRTCDFVPFPNPESTESITADSILRIPVVFNIITKDGDPIIPDSKILEQLDILNAAFRGQSSTVQNTPPLWQPLIKDSKIQFYLANVDHCSGGVISGIRRKSNVNGNTFNIKDSSMPWTNQSQGGITLLDTKRYMNIYIFNINPSGTIGLAKDLNHLIIDDKTLPGEIIPGLGLSLGYTLVHEVGHGFGLCHIGACDNFQCGYDGVDDTPFQRNPTPATLICPTHPRNQNTCSNPDGDMFMNFMDYSNDQCMTLFTHGQNQRMRSYVRNRHFPLYPNLAISTNQSCNTLSPTLIGAPLAMFDSIVWTFQGPTNISGGRIKAKTPGQIVYQTEGTFTITARTYDVFGCMRTITTQVIIQKYSANLSLDGFGTLNEAPQNNYSIYFCNKDSSRIRVRYLSGYPNPRLKIWRSNSLSQNGPFTLMATINLFDFDSSIISNYVLDLRPFLNNYYGRADSTIYATILKFEISSFTGPACPLFLEATINNYNTDLRFSFPTRACVDQPVAFSNVRFRAWWPTNTPTLPLGLHSGGFSLSGNQLNQQIAPFQPFKYLTPGTKSVGVRVITEQNRCTTTVYKNIRIFSPNILLNGPGQACQGDSIRFSYSALDIDSSAILEWALGEIVSGQFQEIQALGTSASLALVAPDPGNVGYRVFQIRLRHNAPGCNKDFYKPFTIYKKIFPEAPIVEYNLNNGSVILPQVGALDPIEISICPGTTIYFTPKSLANPPANASISDQWEGNISADQEDATAWLTLFDLGDHVYFLQAFNGPCHSPKRKIIVHVVSPANALLIEPYCELGYTFAKVSGGTPPYQIQGPATGGIYVPMSEVPEGDSVARLFIIAYDGTNINQGVAGNYLVRDSLGNGCATPFRVWDTPQTQQNLRLEGYHFVQRTLTFDTCTIAKKARVYCYGKPETDPGRPGGRVLGASLVKVSSGDFTIDSGAVIRGQCESMWPGIKVTGPCGPFTRFAMRPGSRIEDAFAGIEVNGAMDSLGFEINKAEFVNNYISLKYDAKTRKRPEIHKSIFRATSGGLKQPFQPGQVHNGSGVGFTSLGGILVAGNTSQTFLIDSCLFSNLFVAIAGGGGPIQIRNSRIEKIRSRGIVLGNLGQTVIINQIESNELVFDAYPIQGWMRMDTTFEKYGLRRDAGDGAMTFQSRALVAISTGGGIEIRKNRIWKADSLNFGYNNKIAGAWVFGGAVRIRNNQWQGLDYGIIRTQEEATPGPAALLDIGENEFEQIGETAVKLHRGRADLRLQCNLFKHNAQATSTQYGLLIGEEARLLGNRIGGNNQNFPGPPCGNYFPKQQISLADTGVDGYVSVRNESALPIDYWRYDNELMGKVEPSTGPGSIIYRFLNPNIPNYIFNNATLIMMCDSSDNCGTSNFSDCIQAIFDPTSGCYPGVWHFSCTTPITDSILWPVPLLKPGKEPNFLSQTKAVEELEMTCLNQPIPNPAQTLVEIGGSISQDDEAEKIQFYGLANGRLLKEISLASKGKFSLSLDVSQWAPGVYGYRLLMKKGKSPSPNKLILIPK